jgi:hypothetical protein
MFKWRPATTFPQQHIWVLAFRPKQPHIVRYEPYIVVYRNGDQWMDASGHMIHNITHWTYLNPPATDTSLNSIDSSKL